MQSGRDLRNYFSMRCTIFAALPTICSYSANFALLLLANNVQSLGNLQVERSLVRPKT